MDKLTKIHHSLEDWEFQPERGAGISTAQYVSPPSSLIEQLVYVPFVTDVSVFLKESLAKCLDNGRFITYHRASSTTRRSFRDFFWSQTGIEPLPPPNTYGIEWASTIVYLFRYLDGDATYITSAPLTFTWNINTWYHFRVTWFLSLGKLLTLVLRVIADVEIAGAWVQQLIWDIATPEWLDSETKRVGFWFKGSNGKPAWIDDTEIWGPA